MFEDVSSYEVWRQSIRMPQLAELASSDPWQWDHSSPGFLNTPDSIWAPHATTRKEYPMGLGLAIAPAVNWLSVSTASLPSNTLAMHH
jgi:hypothetical protein